MAKVIIDGEEWETNEVAVRMDIEDFRAIQAIYAPAFPTGERLAAFIRLDG